MNSKPTRRLWATAYHEAGHAVMAHKLHQGLKRVSIVQGEDYHGYTSHAGWTKTLDPDIGWNCRIRNKFEALIMVFLSGYVAERLFTGRYNRLGATGDFQHAMDYALKSEGTGEIASAYLGWLVEKTKATFHNPAVLLATNDLAKALISKKEIGSREARSIIDLPPKN